ncbi:MAG: phosphotransferase [Acidobacteria bacterium]|nr:phosphotransferase [Acidobacteriota bacterium]MCB9377909.1 phosphotransferase [Holophagales bacterium]
MSIPVSDPRVLDDLVAWLEAIGRPAAETPTLMPGDVSLRRYARVVLAEGEAAIAAYYPPEIRSAQTRFDAAAELLERERVRVPRRLVTDRERGWSLVEDLGVRTLYDHRDASWEALEPALAEAVEIAGRIGRIPAEAVDALGSPPLDRELLRRELRQTENALLEPAGALADLETRAALDAALGALCAELAREPARSCHRDFMARNLVVLGGELGGELGVLDFQDLRRGPAPYDVASLLNDSLFPPDPVEARLLELATGDPRPAPGYRRAVAQRALKAAGTFAAFAARGSDRHVRLIPGTLARASEHLLRLPETADAWRRLLRRSGEDLGLPERLLH